MTNQRTPNGLSARSARLWKSTLNEYEMSPPELELVVACGLSCGSEYAPIRLRLRSLRRG